MALVDVRGDFDVLRLGGLESGFDIGLQGRLIAFDGEQVIRADVADASWRFRDCRRSRRWSRGRPEGCGRRRASRAGRVWRSSRWTCRRQVPAREPDAYRRRRLKTRCKAARPRWSGRGCGARSCRRWRSYRECWPAFANPVEKAGGEQFRIDPVHREVQPTARRNAPIVGQKLAQEPKMRLSPSRDGVETVAVGDRRADAQEQNLVELVLDAFRLARVLDPRKMMQKKAQPRRLLKFVSRLPSRGLQSQSPHRFSPSPIRKPSLTRVRSHDGCSPGIAVLTFRA